ncbi:MAG: hypothetical protein MJZ11_07570 [Lachnospiraceae bacterium]|nr:hypothetical protein [Lachnospiraceae bacterium]
MARKTVFDDVFRTMCQKLPHLLIPLINEAFGTHYTNDEKIEQLRNERFEKNGEIITDSLLEIKNHTYHIECQSNDDSKMVIRMAQYDFSIALENVVALDDGTFQMNFPKSCVIYLRESDSKSRNAVLNIRFQDGEVYPYKMKVICIEDYTQDKIFEENLLIFLPFYILRYENELPTARKCDKDRLNALLEEYQELFSRLENETNDYTDLYNFSIKIINHVVKSASVKRRFMDMGGKVLELESERLISKGREQGREEGKLQQLIELVKDGLLNTTDAASVAKMSEDNFRKLLQ